MYRIVYRVEGCTHHSNLLTVLELESELSVVESVSNDIIIEFFAG